MQDIMVDIETMGQGARAAVASIGAVAFDPFAENTPEELRKGSFYRRLNMRDQETRNFQADTIYWWLIQSDAARVTLTEEQVPTRVGLLNYLDWCSQHDSRARFWCLGATFDHVIIQNLFEDCKLRNPAHYSRQLCFRSLAQFSGVERPELSNNIGHNAVDDCIKQVVWMQQCVKQIGYLYAFNSPTPAQENRIIKERVNVKGPEASSK